MNSIAVVTEGLGLGSVLHGACHWVAAQTLRRLAYQTTCGADDGVGALPPSDDTMRAEDALQTFLTAASADRGSRVPYISRPGRPALTKDECRLLRAIAAAQADDEKLLDNYLYRIALNRKQRARLAEVIHALARALAARDYVLPALTMANIPAPALHVAVMHRPALDEIDVAWRGQLMG